MSEAQYATMEKMGGKLEGESRRCGRALNERRVNRLVVDQNSDRPVGCLDAGDVAPIASRGEFDRQGE